MTGNRQFKLELVLAGDNRGGVNAIRGTRQEMKQLGDQGAETRVALANVRGGIDEMTVGARARILGVAAAVGAVGASTAVLLRTAEAAREFRREIAEISTLLSDTSELDEYTQQIRAQAREFGISATKQADALYQIISAGQEGAAAIDTLDASNRLAIGGITDIEVAADGLTSVLNAYGDKVAGATDVSDTLFVGMRTGKTTIDALSQSIGKVAPIAAGLNVPFTELVSAVSAITTGGVKTTEAVTQVRGALVAVLKPTAEAQDLAGQLGLKFDSQALAAKGLAGFLQDVRDKTHGNKDAMATLFGGVEAINAVMALTGNQAKAFERNLDAMAERSGETGAAFSKMAQEAEFAADRMQAAIQDKFLDAGDQANIALAPAYLAVADNIDLIAEAAVNTGIVLASVMGARLTAEIAKTAAATGRVVLARQQELAVNQAAAASFARMTQARVVDLQQTLRVVAVSRQEAQGSLAVANARVAEAEATMAATRATGAQAAASGMLARAEQQLAAAIAQRTAATNSLAVLGRQQAGLQTQLAVATKATAAAQAQGAAAATQLALGSRLAATAMGGLRAATALVGGPIGAAVLGLTGLVLWLTRSKDAADRFELDEAVRSITELADEAERLKRGGPIISEQDQESLSATHAEIQRIAGAMGQLAELRDEYARQGNGGAAASVQGEMDRLAERIAFLSAELRRYQEASASGAAATEAQADAMGGLSDEAKEAAERVAKYRESLDAQNALIARQLELMDGTRDSQAALRIATMEANGATDQQIALSEQRRAQLEARQQQEKDLADAIKASATEREAALATFETQIAALDQALAEGMDPAEYQARADQLRAVYWDAIRGDAKGTADEVSEARKEIDAFLNADGFSSAAATMREALGTVSDPLFGMLDGFETLTNVSKASGKAMAAAYKEAAGDADKLREFQDDINNRTMRESLGAYGQMAGAASGFFDENSKGYRTLQALSTAFHAAELAMTIQTLVPKGVAAILNQGGGDPYSAIPRMAAMAAIVGGLGVAVSFAGGSGGGGGGEAQPTFNPRGRVLGDPDAMSESIANSVELTAIATEQLVGINSDMLKSLRGLESSIGNVGTLIVRNQLDYGVTPGGRSDELNAILASGPMGALAVAQQRVTQQIDSLFEDIGLDFIGDIVGGIGDLFLKGLSELGNAVFGGEQSIRGQGVQILADSFGDMLDNLQAGTWTNVRTSGGVFSGSSYDIKEGALPAEIERQFALVVRGIGEAVSSTADLLGVAQAEVQAAFDSLEIDLIRIDFQNKSGEEINEALSETFSAMFDDVAQAVVPYIETFQDIGEGLGETLTRLATTAQIARSTLGDLGVDLDAIPDSLRVYIDGFLPNTGDALIPNVRTRSDGEIMAGVFDRLTDQAGGLKAFASNMGNLLDTVLTEGEAFDRLERQLGSALETVTMSLPDSREGLADLVSGINLFTDAGVEQLTVISQLSEGLDDYYQTLARREADRAEFSDDLRDEIEALTLTADELAAVRLDRELEAWRSKAEDLGFDANIIDPLEDLKRAAAEAGGAVADLSAERDAFNLRFSDLNARQGLDGEALDLYDWEQRRARDIAEAERLEADINAVEAWYSEDRLRIVQAAAEAALAIEESRARATAEIQAETERLHLTGLEAELFDLDQQFARRRDQLADNAEALLALDEQYAVRRQQIEQAAADETIAAAEAAAEAERELAAARAQAVTDIRAEIARSGLTGVDAELFDLDAEFARRRQANADNAEALLALDELYAIERNAIVQAAADEAIAAAEAAAEAERELATARAQAAEDIRAEITRSGLTGVNADLFDLDAEFARRRQANADNAEALLALDELYAIERNAIVQAANAETIAAAEAAAEAERELAEARAQAVTDIRAEIARSGLTGVDAELFDLDAEFARRRQANADNAEALLALDELYAIERNAIIQGANDEAIAAAEAAAEAERELAAARAQAVADIRAEITRSGLTGIDADLFDLDAEFARRRQANADNAEALLALDELYAIERNAIIQGANDEAIAAAEAAAEAERELAAARAQAVADIRAEITRSGLTGIDADLFDLDAEFARRRQANADNAEALLALDELYAIRRQQILSAANESALEAEAQRVNDAADILRGAYRRQADDLQALVDEYANISAELQGYRGTLFSGAAARLTPEQAYAQTAARVESLDALASVGDIDAQRQLQGAIDAWLEASSEYNATGAAYFADRDRAAAILDRAIGAADIERDIAQEQLDAITEQVGALIDLTEAVVTLEDAIASYQQIAAGGSAEPAAFATTGPVVTVSGPVPLPEATSPASASAAGAGGDSAAVAELREQNRQLRAMVGLLSAGFADVRERGETTSNDVADIRRRVRQMVQA
ncbi:phage tail tape measure protein [Flagellatimonas centrodinii]|uniref:phage tail tape measure protein n=1 Tax=Flagellatimonas centrodinii TaxID=2806210 RepID=UPI001FEE5F06|nr:phage tail tape measure protein [Flagellatimonas centrodinii]ULQ45973.1 phage tail tape measure protein [Flagellatimonas centrodinii]